MHAILSINNFLKLLTTSTTSVEPERDRIMTRTQTGTDIRPPNRLVYYWAQEGDVT